MTILNYYVTIINTKHENLTYNGKKKSLFYTNKLLISFLLNLLNLLLDFSLLRHLQINLLISQGLLNYNLLFLLNLGLLSFNFRLYMLYMFFVALNGRCKLRIGPADSTELDYCSPIFILTLDNLFKELLLVQIYETFYRELLFPNKLFLVECFDQYVWNAIWYLYHKDFVLPDRRTLGSIFGFLSLHNFLSNCQLDPAVHSADNIGSLGDV